MITEKSENLMKRYERKYICDFSQYLKTKNALYPYTKQDFFTQIKPENKYLVRSLYFDTNENKILFEKSGGISDRIKYRIRTYGTSVESKPDVRVEFKVREANLNIKYGAYISISEYLQFIKTRHWTDNSNPILEEFERHIHLFSLYPKIIVEYLREGYQSLDGDDIRITFDHQIKSAHAKELFPERIFWHDHHEQFIVLEIKHRKNVPHWINKIIKSGGLTLVSNSKFVLGAQSSQPELIHPGWSSQ
jgi:hypothetical protein